jgi:murein L,D-transpeptidase YcbB/YkuD
MKKISIIIVGLTAFSFLSATALATSGECSYHGGVNCSAGASNQGYAVCNDGWISSVSFSNTDECQVSAPVCNYPVQPSCSLSAIQQQEQSALNSARLQSLYEGEEGSGAGAALSLNIENTYSLQYSQCQSQWTAYQSDLSDYNSCIQNQDAVSSQQAANNKIKDMEELDASCAQYNGTGSTWIWNGDMPHDADGNQCTPSMAQYLQILITPTSTTSSFATSEPTTTPALTALVSPVLSAPVSVATSSPSVVINQNLSVGASGSSVINLQEFLVSKGFLALPAGMTEGYFGNLTKKALVSFQASVGLPATGYCGPMTRTAINSS